jgi:hypothetical protein
MKNFILLTILFLGACQTANRNADNFLPSNFIGQSENTLIEVYGTPQSVYNITPSRYVFTYPQTNLSPQTNPYTNEFSYKNNPGPLYGVRQVQTVYDCTYYFTVENGIVVNYSFNGDDC